MKGAIVCIAILAVAFVDSFDSGVRVKFNVGLGAGSDFFYEIPQEMEDASAMKWEKMERPESPMSSLAMHCAQELTICAMYDRDTGFIAGLQVGLNMKEYQDASFDWETQGYIKWTTPNGDEYMTKQLYFISEATLSKSVEERNKTAMAKQVLQETSVYVTGFNQKLMEIPVDVDGIVDAGFTKQACIPWMGQHYYYAMTPETECTAETMLNWFPLTSDGKLIGMGFLSFGNLPEKTSSSSKFYFEKPPKLAVQTIVPSGPQCLYDLAEKPTVTTMHIYFISKPWRVFCPLF